jgi:tetratricopeptide (TPR) repeat protein
MMLGADPEMARRNAIADAEEAVRLDPLDAEALASLGAMRTLQARWTEADELLRRAVELGPANSHVLVIAAAFMAMMGSAEPAATLADRAIRLDPHMTAANATGVKDAYYLARRYADTVALVGRYALENRSRDSQLFFAASLSRLGRADEATAARAELLRLYPAISAERMLNEDYAFRRPEEQAYFVDTFRLLDLPVCLSADEVAAFTAPKRLAECARPAG